MKEALCHRFYLSIAHLPLETNQSRRRHFFTEKKAQLCSRTREALGCIDFTQWVLTSISVPLLKARPWDEEATSFNKTEHPDRRLFSKLKIQGELDVPKTPLMVSVLGMTAGFMPRLTVGRVRFTLVEEWLSRRCPAFEG